LFAGKHTSDIIIDISEACILVLSSRILQELYEVVNFKFPEKKATLERFLHKLNYELDETPTEIDAHIYPQIRDKNDYPILASAIIADVDVFITGDKDFADIRIKRPKIMTIRKFADEYIVKK